MYQLQPTQQVANLLSRDLILIAFVQNGKLCKEKRGAFYSTKNAGLNFQTFRMVRGNTIFWNLQKRRQTRKVCPLQKVLGTIYWEFQNFWSNRNLPRTLDTQGNQSQEQHSVNKQIITSLTNFGSNWGNKKLTIKTSKIKIHTALFIAMVTITIFRVFSGTWGVLVIISVMLFLFPLPFWWMWLFWQGFLFFFLLFCKFLPKSCIQSAWSGSWYGYLWAICDLVYTIFPDRY